MYCNAMYYANVILITQTRIAFAKKTKYRTFAASLPHSIRLRKMDQVGPPPQRRRARWRQMSTQAATSGKN